MRSIAIVTLLAVLLGGCSSQTPTQPETDVSQVQAAARKPVEIGRRRADRDATAIAAEIPPADVVHHENKKIGLFAAARPMFGEPLEGGIDLLGVHEGGLKVLRLANGARGDRVEVGHDLPFRLWSPGLCRAVA